MNEKNTNNYNEDEIFRAWLALIRQSESSQYLYRDRKEHLEHLMEMLVAQGIDRLSASSLERKVIEGLVHSEGMKGQGRYKGWKENVKNDFEDAVVYPMIPI